MCSHDQSLIDVAVVVIMDMLDFIEKLFNFITKRCLVLFEMEAISQSRLLIDNRIRFKEFSWICLIELDIQIISIYFRLVINLLVDN